MLLFCRPIYLDPGDLLEEALQQLPFVDGYSTTHQCHWCQRFIWLGPNQSRTFGLMRELEPGQQILICYRCALEKCPPFADVLGVDPRVIPFEGGAS